MRDTPISRHLKKIAATPVDAGQPVGAATRMQARAQDLMRAKLATDQQRLKATKSIARKIEIKREVLPDYAAYVAEVLAQDAGTQDDVLLTLMVWLIDVGSIDAALAIAQYAIRHGLAMPAPFERSLAEVIAESIAETPDVPAGLLARAIELTDGHDMVDQVRAKLYKAYGLAIAADSPATAADALRRALALNDKIGVKRDIARIEASISVSGKSGKDADT
ncbi:phage terminase small subunit [Paraburkholderia antibiotica]|uniref:Terminase n=1 Tax=Paraburkholderia antibiotica TaxID=2728839 RepID=A0A7X9ZX56_9BURK|nr:phage terminase small subunit [Paraburkholderia antibiotica]NML31794.1 terminase [Paraburkholderia antibiotica]